jgi:hypothetical protein
MKENTMQLTKAGWIAKLQPAPKQILELEEGGSQFPGEAHPAMATLKAIGEEYCDGHS